MKMSELLKKLEGSASEESKLSSSVRELSVEEMFLVSGGGKTTTPIGTCS